MFETLEHRRMLAGHGLCAGDGACVPSGQAIKAGLHAGQNRTTTPVARSTALVALSSTEKADLVGIARDEKLARDVYNAMYQKWGSTVFKNIAASEQQHFTAVSNLLSKYGVANPVASLPAGKFDDPAIQGLYDQLVAKGKTSLKAAMEVGVDIEELDIADLKTAISHTTHSDVKNVYSNLLSGSQNHLVAFNTQLDRLEALT